VLSFSNRSFTKVANESPRAEQGRINEEGTAPMQLVLLILIFLVLLVVIPMSLNKRAIIQVIKRLRQQGALDIESAKTIDELRLNPPTFRERIMRFRDYKPAALQGLIRVGIVQVTEDGKVFLSEEKLKTTKLANV